MGLKEVLTMSCYSCSSANLQLTHRTSAITSKARCKAGGRSPLFNGQMLLCCVRHWHSTSWRLGSPISSRVKSPAPSTDGVGSQGQSFGTVNHHLLRIQRSKMSGRNKWRMLLVCPVLRYLGICASTWFNKLQHHPALVLRLPCKHTAMILKAWACVTHHLD